MILDNEAIRLRVRVRPRLLYYHGLYPFTAIHHKVVQIGDTEIICLLLYNNFVTYGI